MRRPTPESSKHTPAAAPSHPRSPVEQQPHQPRTERRTNRVEPFFQPTSQLHAWFFGKCFTPGLAAHEVEAYLRHGPEGPEHLHPYVVAKLAEDPNTALDGGLTSLIRGHRESGWTLQRVMGMETEALEAQMQAMGLPYTRAWFQEETGGNDSAFALAESWTEKYPLKATRGDRPFLPLAVTVLWARLWPGRPSVEHRDDQMQAGYSLLVRGKDARAIDTWWGLWSELSPRLTEEYRSTDQVGLVAGTQTFGNWCEDLQRVLEHHGRQGGDHARRGVALGRALVRLFPQEEEDSQVGWRRVLAENLFSLRRSGEAMELLEETRRRYPGDVWAHVALADELMGLWTWRASPHFLDHDRALAILKQAQAQFTNDVERDLLNERLSTLEEERARRSTT